MPSHILARQAKRKSVQIGLPFEGNIAVELIFCRLFSALDKTFDVIKHPATEAITSLTFSHLVDSNHSLKVAKFSHFLHGSK